MTDSPEPSELPLKRPSEPASSTELHPANPSPPEPVDELPQIAVSPPTRRSFFRFGILGLLLFTGILAALFAIARLPKKHSDEKFPNIVVTKRGMYVREATYEVRFSPRNRERYQSQWVDGTEKLTTLNVQDFDGGRHFETDASGADQLLTAGHQRAFEEVRAIVRSKVDFDRMSWADERLPADTQGGPRAPFTATIFPDTLPPRAYSYDDAQSGLPAPSGTPVPSGTPTASGAIPQP